MISACNLSMTGISLRQQPLDHSAQAFYKVEKPVPEMGEGPIMANQGDTWTLPLQLELLFPK